MREIKFRAWHKSGKQMFYAGWNGNTFLNIGNLFALGDSVELMQFTGLHDRDGKEIYEGDIVTVVDEEGETHWRDHHGKVHTRLNCGTAPVVWLHELGGWYLDSEINNGLADVMQDNYVSVIGNIHETPAADAGQQQGGE